MLSSFRTSSTYLQPQTSIRSWLWTVRVSRWLSTCSCSVLSTATWHRSVRSNTLLTHTCPRACRHFILVEIGEKNRCFLFFRGYTNNLLLQYFLSNSYIKSIYKFNNKSNTFDQWLSKTFLWGVCIFSSCLCRLPLAPKNMSPMGGGEISHF